MDPKPFLELTKVATALCPRAAWPGGTSDPGTPAPPYPAPLPHLQGAERGLAHGSVGIAGRGGDSAGHAGGLRTGVALQGQHWGRSGEGRVRQAPDLPSPLTRRPRFEGDSSPQGPVATDQNPGKIQELGAGVPESRSRLCPWRGHGQAGMKQLRERWGGAGRWRRWGPCSKGPGRGRWVTPGVLSKMQDLKGCRGDQGSSEGVCGVQAGPGWARCARWWKLNREGRRAAVQ